MIIEINGAADTGKTKLALSMVKNQFKENEDSIVAYIDVDNKLTDERLMFELDSYADKVRICKVNEQKLFYQLMKKMIEVKIFDTVVIDSICNVCRSKQSLDALLKLLLEYPETTFIVVNQERFDTEKDLPIPIYNSIYNRYCDFRYYLENNSEPIVKVCDESQIKRLLVSSQNIYHIEMGA